MEQLSGNGSQLSPYALYGTTASIYDWLGDVTSVTGPADYPTTAAGLNASAQTTTSYDLLGRTVGMSDADLGSGWTYSYDPDGNVLSTIDARGTSGGGAVYASYDGLDRQLTRSVNSNGSNPYVTYSYDSTANGNLGVGRLTGESFTGGTPSDPLSGSYASTYDGRGQVTAWTQTTTEGTPYTLQTAYNDAGQPTSLTYSDGEVFSPGYNSDGWLTSATTVPFGGSQVNLLTAIGYSGVGGAAQHPTSASVGNGTFTYSASYDSDLRLANVTESSVTPSLTLFSSTRTYDAVGNVATVATTLAAGTDNQAFCYDEQNRLTWAGSTGTPPCTGTAITPGSLTSAQYSASYSYDAMNRLTSAPTLGSYTYGTTPLHGATSTTSGGSTVYSASYDAVGDMTCRAPSSAATCVGTPTGQQMTYDAERRVSHWQNSPSNPTSSADYLYDGSGNRVEQVATSGGTSTKVYYLFGGLEEVSSAGSTSTLTKYYSAGGLLIGVNVGGTISYLASDGLGSVSEALSTSGTATAAQLYGPYGGVRYSSGTMPTAKGFTGQRADANSGLDYYGARYYDPVLGQFASADTKQGPNRYAYVADDPETLTDPTGHLHTTGTSGDASDPNTQYTPGGVPWFTYAEWRAKYGSRGSHYISRNIHVSKNAPDANQRILNAATDVAALQNTIGGIGGDPLVHSYGQGVLEFYYKNDAGVWQYMYMQKTDFWESDGPDAHVEWLVLNGPSRMGSTIVSLLQAWVSNHSDTSRWKITVSIISGYPTCQKCQDKSYQDNAYAAEQVLHPILNVVGFDTQVNVRMYGLQYGKPDNAYSYLNEYSAINWEMPRIDPVEI